MINPAKPDFTNTPASPQRARFGYAPADPSVQPCVSIVTPFYNTGEVFQETARSVLQQSLQQWEWLIVDDASTDPASLAMLDSYRQSDPRIRVIRHENNQGLSASRNTGYQAARTPYVVQLDSDDLLEPTAVEKWAWYLESHPEHAFVKGKSVAFGAQNFLINNGFHCGSGFLQENQVNATSAIRKAVHKAVGGYDAENRDGLEDWEFWLKAASKGHWGTTIPEYLDWYRRRPDHSDRWPNYDGGKRQEAYARKLRMKYAGLSNGGFPKVLPKPLVQYDAVPDTLPFENRLVKAKPRILILTAQLMVGGVDKFNIDVTRQLMQRGWDVTVAATRRATHPWLPEFAAQTPDVFVLHHFLRLVDHPRFLRYLIQSRGIDVVFVTISDLGYHVLPYLRAHFPDVTFVDCNHINEEVRCANYPQYGVDYQELLDLSLTTSNQLKHWMVERGADPQRNRVLYTNVDIDRWRPEPEQRASVRRQLGVDDDCSLILYPARICAQKQPRVFARAMEQLAGEGVNVVALAAGDGPDMWWLREYVKRKGLERHVRLLGAVSNDRVHELLVAADIFFLPSKWEGIALAIFEAMACGVPVVGADVGGQRELLTPECGILLPRSDERTEAAQYAGALAELLRDPKRRNAMGRASRDRVIAHFRLDAMGDRLVDILREAQQLHSDHPRPNPGLGLGHICATQAVEYARASLVRLQEVSIGKKAYLAVRRLLHPQYEALAERNAWLIPLKERFRKTLIG